MLRRCSDTEGAEEIWTGLRMAGLTSNEQQTWRWPARFLQGERFEGVLTRSVLGQAQRVERVHRFEEIERVSTPLGSFDAWRVATTDTGAGQTARGHQWVSEELGLIRLEQDSPAGRLTLELIVTET